MHLPSASFPQPALCLVKRTGPPEQHYCKTKLAKDPSKVMGFVVMGLVKTFVFAQCLLPFLYRPRHSQPKLSHSTDCMPESAERSSPGTWVCVCEVRSCMDYIERNRRHNISSTSLQTMGVHSVASASREPRREMTYLQVGGGHYCCTGGNGEKCSAVSFLVLSLKPQQAIGLRRNPCRMCPHSTRWRPQRERVSTRGPLPVDT